MKKIMGILLLLVFICLATAILSNGRFVTPFNMQNIVRRSSFYGIIGIGVAFVIITGGIDLSIGSLIGLVGCMMPMLLASDHVVQGEPVAVTKVNVTARALMLDGKQESIRAGDLLRFKSASGSSRELTINQVNHSEANTIVRVNQPVSAVKTGTRVTRYVLRHTSFAVVIILVLVFTLVIGLIHGLMITKINLQPFVVTLCGLLIYRGVARWITSDTTQGFGSDYDNSFRLLATGKPFSVASVMIAVGIVFALWLASRRFWSKNRAARPSGLAFTLGVLFSLTLIGFGSLRYVDGVSSQKILDLAKSTPIQVETKKLTVVDVNVEKKAILVRGEHPSIQATGLLLMEDTSQVKSENKVSGKRKIDWATLDYQPVSGALVETKQTVIAFAVPIGHLIKDGKLKPSVELYKVDLIKMDLASYNPQSRDFTSTPGLPGLLPQIAMYFAGFLMIPAFLLTTILLLRVNARQIGLPVSVMVGSIILTGIVASKIESDVSVRFMFLVFGVIGLLIFSVSRFIQVALKIGSQSIRLPLIATSLLATVWLLGNTPIGQTLVPAATLWLLVIAVVAAIFLNRTIYGRYLLALGRNVEAAKYSGINTDRMIIVAYIICSVCAGIGGILFALDGNSIQPASHGNFYELYAIAAAVLGGCSLRGGEGSIAGVVIGAAVMFVLYNAINLLGIPSTLEFSIIGLVILVGAMTDEVAKKLKDRKLSAAH
jgi:ribose/xylose/arabinose/galactoside ABC-type transport system permease subunit